ncbi:MAG: hypothetical protein DWH91_07230 [Planctomycetota bacterium]|nr:MAG: hypothetical protein DWH91_07230 [Planctomycetota bacterium]
MVRCRFCLCWIALLWTLHPASLQLPVVHGQSSTPFPGRTAVDRRIDSTLTRARLLPKSGQSIEILEHLLASEKLSSEQLARVTKDLVKYRDYQQTNMVRQGPTWIEFDEAQRRAAEADSLIERGVSYMQAGNHATAKEAFQEASEKDRAGIRADFVLGILNSPLGPETPNSPKEWKEFFKAAEGHFRQILVRSPDLSCVVNNLALIYVRQARYKEALVLWNDLNKEDPDSPHVLHNVSELVEQIKKGRVYLGKTDEKAIQSFYADLTAGSGASRAPRTPGWRYTNLTLSQAEEARTRFDQTAVNAPASSGTGFVVHPGYLLTAAHLVLDANSITVTLGSAAPVEVEPLVISVVHDLAILKLPNENASSLPFSAVTPPASDSVTQLGFSSRISSSPLATRQFKLSPIPNTTHYSQLLLYQGIANPGFSGGPVCDGAGNVIGMSTTLGSLDRGLTPTIPTAVLDAFVEKHLPEFRAMRRTEKNVVTPEMIHSRMADSVARVEVTKRYHNFGFGQAANPTFAVDLLPTCCVGTGKVECGVCRSTGTISVKEMVKVGTNKLTGKDQFQQRGVKKACQKCRGSGVVKCPFSPLPFNRYH